MAVFRRGFHAGRDGDPALAPGQCLTHDFTVDMRGVAALRFATTAED